jgi:hypothetical protein
MGKIIVSDLYKIIKDRQTIILFIAYAVLMMANWLSSTNTQIAPLERATNDFGLIFIFVSLVAPAPFAIEYANDSLKDILPYYSRRQLYAAKWLSVILVTVVAQLFCYLLGIAYACIVSQLPAPGALLAYMSRYITQLVINLASVSIILFIAVFLKRRALINALVLLVLLMTRFIPVGSNVFLYEYLVPQYAWGASPDLSFIAIALAGAIAITCIAYAFFRSREV